MGVEAQALRRLHLAWDAKIRGMKGINQSSKVEPMSPQAVFGVDEDDQHGTEDTVKVDCGPVVFNLCERANGRPDMYIAVQGWIRMEESGAEDVPLRTVGFATKVGYFRLRGQRLKHVYGVHYDMDESGGDHPVFHAQLGPMGIFVTEIRERFRLQAEVDDLVAGLLRNVRTPTAQMDFMSVFTQLCADHLLGGSQAGRHAQVVNAFGRVRSACDFLLGAAHRFPYLNAGEATQCYRSSRWYGA